MAGAVTPLSTRPLSTRPLSTRSAPRRAVLAALAGLSGCTLIDQTTFDPAAGQRPAIPPSPSPPLPPAPETGAPALLSIRLPTTANLPSDIAKAVAAARARKPEVVFDVVELAPAGVTAPGTEATEVARLITAQRVPASRIHLAVRPVVNAPREVRVYVH